MADNMAMDTGKLVKMEVDYESTCDERIPECIKMSKEGKTEDALDSLLALEKQTRTGADMVSTGRVLVAIVQICFEAKNWSALNEHILLLSKRRSQLKQAVAKMVQECCKYVDQAPDKETKVKLIDTLRTVTEGKIYVEVERARLTHKLAKMKEDDGDVVEAANIIQELQVETYGSMNKKEKVELILEQMRLCLAKKDYVRTQIISKKVNTKFFDDEGTQELKLKYYRFGCKHCDGGEVLERLCDGGEVLERSCESGEVLERSCESGEVLERLCESGEVLERSCDGGEVLERLCDGGEVLERLCDGGEVLERSCESGEVLERFCVGGEVLERFCVGGEVLERSCDGGEVFERLCDGGEVLERSCDGGEVSERLCESGEMLERLCDSSERLMIELDQHEGSYLSICKHYRAVLATPTIQGDADQRHTVLQHVVCYLVLAQFDHEQADLTHRVLEDKLLDEIPLYKKLLQLFTTPELIKWGPLCEVYELHLKQGSDQLKATDVFSASSEQGRKRWQDLRSRVVEHNIRVMAKYYTKISVKRMSELLDLSAEVSNSRVWQVSELLDLPAEVSNSRVWQVSELLDLSAEVSNSRVWQVSKLLDLSAEVSNSQVWQVSELLDLFTEETEEILSQLVVSKAVTARTDRPAGVVSFTHSQDPGAVLTQWSEQLSSLMQLVNRTTHLINKEEMVHKHLLATATIKE
uniref:PCI domain-containing protein n=2 Tax=Timema TaxID=61471 RepID=A0A7R9EV98_9NEOP|nr:unnamed protein product [Timema bartmani]